MEVTDAEIQMDVFRLMRSGRYLGKQGAKQLIVDAKALFSEEPADRITRCIHELTQRLMKETTP